MKREDIKNAAQEYSEVLANIAYSGGGHIGQDDLEVAFVEGAEWRINRVWHDASEIPDGKRKYIVVLKIGNKIRYNIWNRANNYSYKCVIKWAYIEDLLPINIFK